MVRKTLVQEQNFPFHLKSAKGKQGPCSFECILCPQQVVQDLRKTLAQELDFRQEAANSRALAAATARNPSVAVPRVHDALSNRRVIVMEWVSGAKVRCHH